VERGAILGSLILFRHIVGRTPMD